MATESWPIDLAHSFIRFTVRHMVITKVRGRFRRWQADLQLDETDLARSRVDVSIDVASIDTNDESRDAYLRSADFLDTEKYPTITFETTKVTPRGKSALALNGDLTIRDVTKAVTLEVRSLGKMQDPQGNLEIGFGGKVSISREAFGAKWNQALETGGVVVGKIVEVELELRATAPK